MAFYCLLRLALLINLATDSRNPERSVSVADAIPEPDPAGSRRVGRGGTQAVLRRRICWRRSRPSGIRRLGSARIGGMIST